ncbi:hypothetical protein CL6EHI_027030 [Entamoeba histolytica]|uniref:Uncharacterized protein n=3 Tax=Entamoeba histolytica TaxID=5759 RepID=C4MBG3_ENTH1|nr:hypothetical protein EHI_027030 [Entamoeba histolytica HM-1:IMSS]EAL43369.1 hypothetical protein EHI_027030 [Entamoeba histolytica HM-1:IMSS]EMD46657.1 Hypothetical protein EHI5A_278770 [Entamoeba histolytica KU27]GAT99334.1 hypothetical protein CL6EHI_027030 [Entamoeba histolytica]|eukprot:XP_648755.1 hypothetical protein EHI_027030 [Entamoeba histolytica HM-1:IMSS]
MTNVYNLIHDNITEASCEKYKLLNNYFNENTYELFDIIINRYSREMTITELIYFYNLHRYANDPANWISIMLHECGFAIGIITRIKREGVFNLTPADFKLVLPYLDDFWARDGLAGAWDILLEVYRKQNGEI